MTEEPFFPDLLDRADEVMARAFLEERSKNRTYQAILCQILEEPHKAHEILDEYADILRQTLDCGEGK